MNNSIQVINWTGNQALDKPGRLAHDFGTRKNDVLIKITQSVFKAAGILGISMDAEKCRFTVDEVVKKIMADYPLAYVDDIALAIEMASFGQIVLPNQLHTISAANIYGWYKTFRLEHSHMSTNPHKLPPYSDPEVSKDEKVRIMVKAFSDFITSPEANDTALELYFTRIIQLGAWRPSNEAKIEVFNRWADKLCNAIPMNLLQDSLKRKKAYQFRDYFLERKEGGKVDFSLWQENPLFFVIKTNAKREMMASFLKTADKAALIELYTQYARQ